MALRIDALTDSVSRTAGLLNYNSAYTASFWLYLDVDTDTFQPVWLMSADSFDNSTSYTNSEYVDVLDDMSLRLVVWVGGAFTDVTGSTIGTGIWYHVAVVRESATSAKLYLNGVLDITNTRNVTGRTAIGGEWFGRIVDTYALNGRVAAMKQWQSALDIEEIKNESRCYAPIRPTLTFAPFLAHTDLTDYASGNSYSATVGTPTTADGPPIPWRWGRGKTYVTETAAGGVVIPVFAHHYRQQGIA